MENLHHTGTKSLSKYIDKIYNKIKVLSFSHDVKIGKNIRHYYNIECLNCGKESVVRDDRFSDKIKNSSCKHCQQEKAVEGSKKRSSSETVIKNMFGRYKYSAKLRGYDFNIDYSLFKKTISMNCYYCNSEPIERKNNINRSNNIIKSNGIDRFDNSKGYSAFNILPCCTICNLMKRNLEFEEFLEHVSKIYNKNS